MKNFFVTLSLLFSLLSAQEVEQNKLKKKADAAYLISKKRDWVLLQKDSLFQLNLGFRVQSRVGYGKTEGESGCCRGEIRRMRLKLDGFVYIQNLVIK
jgi:hypothetical protein